VNELIERESKRKALLKLIFFPGVSEEIDLNLISLFQRK
jgi:hypothetical protein